MEQFNVQFVINEVNLLLQALWRTAESEAVKEILADFVDRNIEWLELKNITR